MNLKNILKLKKVFYKIEKNWKIGKIDINKTHIEKKTRK